MPALLGSGAGQDHRIDSALTGFGRRRRCFRDRGVAQPERRGTRPSVEEGDFYTGP